MISAAIKQKRTVFYTLNDITRSARRYTVKETMPTRPIAYYGITNIPAKVCTGTGLEKTRCLNLTYSFSHSLCLWSQAVIDNRIRALFHFIGNALRNEKVKIFGDETVARLRAYMTFGAWIGALTTKLTARSLTLAPHQGVRE